MKRLLTDIRPIALMGIACGTFISLLWFQTLLLDEFASRFALSDQVSRLFRLTHGIIVFQGIGMLALIIWLEWSIAKQRQAATTAPET